MTVNALDQNHFDAGATAPRVGDSDVRTVVLNQISWGAVFAGAVMALVIQTILNMVGIGVGLASVDAVAGTSPTARTLTVGAGVWLVVSGIVASAIGGHLAGRLSGKPLPMTAAYHGLMSWAVSTLVVLYVITSAATGVAGGAFSTVSSAIGGAGRAVGATSQAAAPALNDINDPLKRIENQVRDASGGQDPAALRDTAVSAVRAALVGDANEQSAATARATDALAKAQGISQDQARQQVADMQQKYTAALEKTKEQAKVAADATAKTVSRGAIIGAIALLLGALAAFFAGNSSAVASSSGLTGTRRL